MIQIRHYAASGTLAKTIALTYDNVGNLKTYNDGITSAAYDYDDVYRKTQETVNYGAFSLTTSYAYNKNGTKKSFTYPGGVTIDYTYDGNNQPLGMNIPGAGYLTYNTYRWNRPTAITLPGGGTKQYDYDPLMRTKTIAGNNPSQNPILSYQYGYDKMDNITQKNTEHGNYGYGYDELYRLIQAANAAQGDEAYTYDQVGNRLTSTAASDWTYNQNNEFQSYSGVSFQYDANGNATQKNEGAQIRDFIYDADNRLIEVRDGSNSTIATYSYDLFGRRIKKDVGGTVTYYLYSDEGLIGEYGSAGNEIKTYGYKPNSTWTTDPVFMKEGGNHYFYHNDHLGTPQKMTTVSGAVAWSATYDAFGKATVDAGATVANNLRFPGQYNDQETGLHYNYFRDYSPIIGRYIEEDPVGLRGGIDLYAYVSNRPIILLDPWGLWTYPTTGPIRGNDAWGSGAYGARRDGGSRKHAGVDYSGVPGSNVYAPIGGTVEIIGGGVRITGQFDGEKYSVRVLHINVTVERGKINEGDIIGTVEDLQEDYPRIIDHAHVEIYKRENKQDKRKNPRNYIPPYNPCE